MAAKAAFLLVCVNIRVSEDCVVGTTGVSICHLCVSGVRPLWSPGS